MRCTARALSPPVRVSRFRLALGGLVWAGGAVKLASLLH